MTSRAGNDCFTNNKCIPGRIFSPLALQGSLVTVRPTLGILVPLYCAISRAWPSGGGRIKHATSARWCYAIQGATCNLMALQVWAETNMAFVFMGSGGALPFEIFVGRTIFPCAR